MCQSAFRCVQFVSDVMKPLTIEPLMDFEVQNLSGGELQRVALALCLGQPADIYLIDEPSAYLDSEQRILAAKASNPKPDEPFERRHWSSVKSTYNTQRSTYMPCCLGRWYIPHSSVNHRSARGAACNLGMPLKTRTMGSGRVTAAGCRRHLGGVCR